MYTDFALIGVKHNQNIKKKKKDKQPIKENYFRTDGYLAKFFFDLKIWCYLGIYKEAWWSIFKNIWEVFHRYIPNKRAVYLRHLLSVPAEERIWRMEAREREDLRSKYQNCDLLLQHVHSRRSVVWFQSVSPWLWLRSCVDDDDDIIVAINFSCFSVDVKSRILQSFNACHVGNFLYCGA